MKNMMGKKKTRKQQTSKPNNLIVLGQRHRTDNKIDILRKDKIGKGKKNGLDKLQTTTQILSVPLQLKEK